MNKPIWLQLNEARKTIDRQKFVIAILTALLLIELSKYL